MAEQLAYWFPAKTYGWGWGLPTVWQGWATLAVALALFVLGSAVIAPRVEPLLYGLYMLAIAAALLAVCMAKGAPTTWRWGEK